MKPPIEITQTTKAITMKNLSKLLREVTDSVFEQILERKTSLVEPQRYKISLVVEQLSMLD